MKTINLPMTPDQIRDLLNLADQASVRAIIDAKALRDAGKVKAAAKTDRYADRLLSIVDTLEAAVAALDIAGK